MNYEQQLAHYGIKGMRWGIRKRKAQAPPSSDRARVNQLKKKGLRNLTNDELKELNSRLQLERSYKDLKKQDYTVGQQIVVNMMSDLLKQSVSSLTKRSIKELEKKLNKK